MIERALVVVIGLLFFAGCASFHSPALDEFNAEVARHRGNARVFLGAQPGEGGEDVYAWTTCIPESNVFVVQASKNLLTLPRGKVRFAGAHEICHVRLHQHVMCSGEYQGLPTVRKRELEAEADRCAIALLMEAK